MGFKVKADLVPLFRGLVTGLQAFASVQEVGLTFHSESKNLYASYNPEYALSEITVLLSRIITFTPQSYHIMVTLKDCGDDTFCKIIVENTGVDLSKVGNIIESVKEGLAIEKLDKGTRFIVTLPINGSPNVTTYQEHQLLPKKYPMYFAAVSKRLSSHFSSTANMEKAALKKGSSEGVFLKKVNAVIHSHLDDPDFKVDALASAMALSRTQLYRKVKALTKRSPQQYLRYVRLEKAKILLQALDHDLNICEVGYRVGFSSKSHFTRSFQKEFGFNPSDMR